MSKRFTYAIGDVHGCFDLLERAFAAIAGHSAAHAGGERYTIVTLGDYIDRGSDSRKVIERLMRGSDGNYSLICLMGNHEAMMVETIREDIDPAWWWNNGGAQTMASYEGVDGSGVPISHVDWAASRRRFHVDQYRVYVHAFVDPDLALNAQDQDRMIWHRYSLADERGYNYGRHERHVVHGHTPYVAGPILLRGRTNLDTGAFFTGRLTVGVFDDALPGGPVEILEVRA